MSAKQKKRALKKPEPTPGVAIPLGGILVMMGIGILLVLGARAGQGQVLHLMDLLPFGLWLVSALILTLFLRAGGYRGPGALPGMILILSAVGVLVRSRMEGSVEGLTGWNHLVQPLGFVWIWLGWLFSRRGRVSCMQPFWPLTYMLSLALLAGLFVMGTQFRGAMYGPGGMTPSEILKIFLPITLAGFFTSKAFDWTRRPCWNPPVGGLCLLGLGWAALSALLVLYKDMGLVLLLSVMLVVMLVAVTRSWSWLILFAGILAGSVWWVIEYMAHGARRFHSWLNLFADPTGANWQVLQGLTGLYAGGLSGTGLGGGQPDRLPIAGSDFVYAVYGEEMGYLGCLLLLALFAGLLRQTSLVANEQEEPFAGSLATGLAALLAAQVVVNIAGVVTLLPITGITLPYISQGGSSYWVISIQFGLLLGLADRTQGGKKAKGRR
jgi:cell division protein FtsW (lipid II flippase)